MLFGSANSTFIHSFDHTAINAHLCGSKSPYFHLEKPLGGLVVGTEHSCDIDLALDGRVNALAERLEPLIA